MNAIEVKNITRTLGDFTLDNVNLTLPQGVILGLVGENGAGKSTTINLIMNAITPDSGTITVMGVDNQSKEFTKLKEDIGVVLDEPYFPEQMTPSQVGKMMKLTYKNWDERVYQGYLEKFKLSKNKKFKEFSRGMRMKLSIAIALSHNAKLLILDEATSGLDPMARDELLDTFSEFTRDETHSILMSSHIISDLEKVCDYIAFMHQGKVEFFEEKDKLMDEYAIIRLSQTDFISLPETAIVRSRESKFGMEALVKKKEIASVFVTERTKLEDIIIFWAKGE